EVEPLRVRPRAAAETDHSITLASVGRRASTARQPKTTERRLDVPVRSEQVARRRIEVGAVPRLQLPQLSQPRVRTDVERIQINLLRREAERLAERVKPRLERLPGVAIDEVDIQDRKPLAPDPLERSIDFLRPLRTPHSLGLGGSERLYAQADALHAEVGEHL